MAGTWLDITADDPPPLDTDDRPFVRKKDGGRHWARTSDLLHVKQGRPPKTRATGLVERDRARLKPSIAASRLDNGWTPA